MRIVRNARGAFVLAAALSLASCAGGNGTDNKGDAGGLDAAKRSCDAAFRRVGDTAPCDRFVEAAVAAGDETEIAEAYLLRSFLHELRDDLPAALADTDRAIAAWPQFTASKRRRGQLLAASGDYDGARALFEQLRGIDEDPAFDETLAFIEYMDGDRSKAPALLRSSAASYRDVDHNEWMAANLGFDAAIIESELRGGDLAPIAAVEDAVAQDELMSLIWRHRMGKVDDAGLLRQVEGMPRTRLGKHTCFAHFSIGHRNAVAGSRAAATEAFQNAVRDCRKSEFEYHAAKAWLKQLGG